ncbi:MAG: hypothetical protein KAR47_10615 [Planctomycetes bacterium]|nr:hypothetical protein [Planctomycetota bacterium]
MDSFFVYAVVRLCLIDRPAMITSVKWLAFASIPLALLGVIETFTGWQPFVPLQAFCPWESAFVSMTRFGLYRAVGSFPQPILFGTFFAMLLPMVYHLRFVPGYSRMSANLICGAVIAGTLSSMSSGPFVVIGLAIFLVTVASHFKHWIKTWLLGFVICCFLIEFTSNRHFYYVFATRLNPLGGSGWQRARLVDCMIQNFGEWWLVGYRGLDPGWMAMSWTDICSMFVLSGVRYGILGVIAFCGIFICSLRNMVRLYNCTNNPELRAWAWALGCTLVVVMVASMQCGLRGQVSFLFFVILAMVGSSSNLISKVRIPQSKMLQNYSYS